MEGVSPPNFTQVPNEIIELMPHMKEGELRIIIAICRKTFGWRKDRDTISLSQFMSLTGMTRQGVINGLDGPIASKIIDRVSAGQSFSYRLKVVNEVDWSTKLTGQRSRPVVVNEVDHQVVNEVDTQKKGLKKGKKGSDSPSDRDSGFAEDSWQIAYANALRERLAERGSLAKPVERATPKKRAEMMQKWADVFDKLHRIDGYAQDEIAEVMKWLVAPDNWWMQTGNLRSGMKLRDKPKGSEETYFDQSVVRMRQAKSHPVEKPIDLTQPVTHDERARVMQKYGLKADAFYGHGKDWKGDPLYKLNPQYREAIEA